MSQKWGNGGGWKKLENPPSLMVGENYRLNDLYDQ